LAKQYLVTGAAGFIGSHVAEALLQRGDVVVGLDNFNDYYDPARKRANVGEVETATGSTDRFRLVEGDIRDVQTIDTLFSETAFDAVVHLAAMAGVRASIEDPGRYYDVNLTGTLCLLEASARCTPSPTFVLASTSSVYGATERLPFEESDPCDRPLVPYSASKRAAELLGYSFHNLYGLDVTALRFFTVYGPRGRPDMMAFKVAESVRSGLQVPLYNGGQMFRDWTYISDIVAGVVAAADRKLGYEVINLGRGAPVLLADFVSMIEDYLGRRAQLSDQPMPTGDVPKTHANIDKARQLLGYDPTVSVEAGVEAFLKWFGTAGT
jgi:UDP-glucuronate 4-epimerase